MSNLVELKPCPFCGGVAYFDSGVGEYWVRCGSCGASSRLNNFPENAIDDWNRRTP